jgi:dTDP-4-dehydrorhamnose reductase
MSPTHAPDLVHAALDLLMDGESGIWHLANKGRLSWVEFGRSLAEAAGLDASLIEPADVTRLGWRAPRPSDVALGSRRGMMLPEVDDAIERFVRAYVPPSARLNSSVAA